MTEKQSFRLPPRFDFAYHTTFNKTCEELLSDTKSTELELDFSQVNYLDSSALGMLVLLSKKNNAAVKAKRLTIRGARDTALDILNMANMNTLYELV
ncbi:STAS domain-containing protein [Colwelliaceae bacterium 6471]